MKAKLGIFISGRGSNMLAILEACRSGALADCAVVEFVFSNKCEAAGLRKAEALGVSTFCIDNEGLKRKSHEKQLLEVLERKDFDLIILAGYMRVISADFVRLFPKKIINIHPADTKVHQGLGAYDWAWKERLIETKLTVHFVEEGLDTGEIIHQEIVNLQGADSLEEVERRGLAVEHVFYSEAIKKVINGKEFKALSGK